MPTNDEPLRAIRLSEVLHRTGMSRSAMYALVKRGLFPPSTRITGTTIAVWNSQAVDRWVHDQLHGAESA